MFQKIAGVMMGIAFITAGTTEAVSPDGTIKMDLDTGQYILVDL